MPSRPNGRLDSLACLRMCAQDVERILKEEPLYPIYEQGGPDAVLGALPPRGPSRPSPSEAINL